MKITTRECQNPDFLLVVGNEPTVEQSGPGAPRKWCPPCSKWVKARKGRDTDRNLVDKVRVYMTPGRAGHNGLPSASTGGRGAEHGRRTSQGWLVPAKLAF